LTSSFIPDLLGGYGKEKDLVAAHMTLRTRGVAFQVFEVSLSMATASVRPDRFMTFVALKVWMSRRTFPRVVPARNRFVNGNCFPVE